MLKHGTVALNLKMKPELKIHKLDSGDRECILKIANWYKDEWNTPVEKTIKRLSNQPNEDILFQLVVRKQGQEIATGGLCHEVNLHNVYPEFKKFGPWVALLYTEREYRNQGIGKILLEHIELQAGACKLDKIYLYTFTAESLYRRSGWQSIKKIKYKNNDTLIMEKEIKSSTTIPKLY